MLEGKSSWESWVRGRSEEGLEMERKKRRFGCYEGLKGRSKEGLGEVVKNKKLQQGHPSFASVVVSSSYCYYLFFIESVKMVNNLGTNIMLLMCEAIIICELQQNELEQLVNVGLKFLQLLIHGVER
jgi:hypothetical protein